MDKMHNICPRSTSLTLVLSITLTGGLFQNHVSHAQPEQIPTANRIKFTNSALKFIDGVPFGIDAKAIQDMLHIRKQIREMLYGIYDKQLNMHIGRYLLGSEKHCIKSLVALENKYEEDFTRRKNELYAKYVNTTTFNRAWELHQDKLKEDFEKKLLSEESISIHRNGNDEQKLLEIKNLQRKFNREYEDKLPEEREIIRRKHMVNPGAYDKELQKIQKEHESRMAPLMELLKKIKFELMNITTPFLERARSSKELLLPLMEEWAEKSGRPFSPLLRWHEEEHGTEEEIFNRDAYSLSRIDIFCTDLVDFNESIIYNCPRGYKQFMEILSGLKQST